jgi:hypothetical protein
LSLVALTGCSGFFVYPGSSSLHQQRFGRLRLRLQQRLRLQLHQRLLALRRIAGCHHRLSILAGLRSLGDGGHHQHLSLHSQQRLSGEIYGYSIGTGGALTILNSSLGLEAENSSALDVSPDGQWLFSLNADGLTLEEYKINTSTGLLTAEGNYPITGIAGGVVTPNALKIAPSGNYIACALGTAGVDVFAFTTSTGVASSSAAVLPPLSTANGFYSLAIDSSNNLYLSGTSGLVVYTVVANSSGSVTATLASSSPATRWAPATSRSPSAPPASYVFAGSQNGGTSGSTIYSYAIGTGGALTAVSGSPFNGPTDVAALGRDSTGNYLLGTGLQCHLRHQLFTIGSAERSPSRAAQPTAPAHHPRRPGAHALGRHGFGAPSMALKLFATLGGVRSRYS